jgi:hypothetical protein
MNGLSNDAVSILRTSTNIIGACLNTGSLLFNTFTLSRVNLPTEQNSNIVSLDELLKLLEDARIDARTNRVRKPAGRPQSTTAPVNLVQCSDGTILKFDNFNAART